MNIFIIDDLILEGDEAFHVTIFTADSDVFLKTDITTIVIMDNEGNYCFSLNIFYSVLF